MQAILDKKTTHAQRPQRPFTLAVRICAGCRGFLGLARWPWNGEYICRTHGLCDGCFDCVLDASSIASDGSIEMSDTSGADKSPNAVSWSRTAGTLRIVVSGQYGIDDVEHALGEASTSESLPFDAMILDLTRSRETRTAEELRSFAKKLGKHRRTISGRCAILVADSMRFGLARMLQVYSESHGVVVRPFREPDRVTQWIAGRTI